MRRHSRARVDVRWHSSSYDLRAAAAAAASRGTATRQLFDHRKDDPVRFSVMARPPVSAHGRPIAPTPKIFRRLPVRLLNLFIRRFGIVLKRHFVVNHRWIVNFVSPI